MATFKLERLLARRKGSRWWTHFTAGVFSSCLKALHQCLLPRGLSLWKKTLSFQEGRVLTAYLNSHSFFIHSFGKQLLVGCCVPDMVPSAEGEIMSEIRHSQFTAQWGLADMNPASIDTIIIEQTFFQRRHPNS